MNILGCRVTSNLRPILAGVFRKIGICSAAQGLPLKALLDVRAIGEAVVVLAGREDRHGSLICCPAYIQTC